jgi:hypothetical protein
VPVLVPQHRLGLALAESRGGKGKERRRGRSPDIMNWMKVGLKKDDGRYDKVG